VLPQALYGAAAGVPPRLLAQLRTARARTVKSEGADACPTTLLDLPPSQPLFDPAVMRRWIQLDSWRQLWLHTPAVRRPGIVKAWAKLWLHMRGAKVRWPSVTGPLSANLATLLDLGWVPLKPFLWVDDVGVALVLTAATPPERLLEAVRASVMRTLWTQAAKYHNAAGLVGSVDWTVWHRVQQSLTAGRQHAAAGMFQVRVATNPGWADIGSPHQMPTL
jgi:hypothetical protein